MAGSLMTSRNLKDSHVMETQKYGGEELEEEVRKKIEFSFLFHFQSLSW